MSMPLSMFAKLFPRLPNTIRRFHGTAASNVKDIAKHGLSMNKPGVSDNQWLYTLPEYPGVYTTVNPTRPYFSPVANDQALVILDIPKDAYRQLPRQSYNAELPAPPPKPVAWDKITLDPAWARREQNFLNETPNKYDQLREQINELSEEGLPVPKHLIDDYRSGKYLTDELDILDAYRTIVPIQQGGRVDIFKSDLSPNYISDILYKPGTGDNWFTLSGKQVPDDMTTKDIFKY